MFSNEAFHIAKNLYAKARDSRRSKADVVVWLAEQIDALIAARSEPAPQEERKATTHASMIPTFLAALDGDPEARLLIALHLEQPDPAPPARVVCDGKGHLPGTPGFSGRVYTVCPGCPACTPASAPEGDAP